MTTKDDPTISCSHLEVKHFSWPEKKKKKKNTLNTYFAKQLKSMSIIIKSIIADSCKIKVT